jgi:hypothetical protein
MRRGRQTFRQLVKPPGKGAAEKLLVFHLGTGFFRAPLDKREVKTASFSPPGVGGVLHGNLLAAQQACPARQVCGLTRGLLFAMR